MNTSRKPQHVNEKANLEIPPILTSPACTNDKKYDHVSLRTSGYKKLKAYDHFKEGHLKDIKVTTLGGLTYVKAAVLASKKQCRDRTVIVLNHNGQILKAACKCLAG